MSKTSTQILSDITAYLKYAKYIPDAGRRETWAETIDRNKEMHLKKFPFLKDEIDEAYALVYGREILPSMRSLQFGGKPIKLNPIRGYNCCFRQANTISVFHEAMFVLLSGTGFGYSVQTHHVEQLPEVKRPLKKTKRFLVSDSIEGWADAIKAVVFSYFKGTSTVEFDFSDIREKGSLIKTSGGKAPGPQPLKDCIHNLKKVFDSKTPGTKLTALEVHDMVCYIADAVLSGGIRRSALIALFSVEDNDMLTCKFGNWYEKNPQRARANNSAVIVRHKVTKKTFLELWSKIKASGSGEPGLFFTNDSEFGTNPCCEIALRNFQFCNLTTVNGADIKTQQELERRVKAAAFIGTIQASYTDFHYLGEEWKTVTEREALLGVSITGLASSAVLGLSLKKAAKVAIKENRRVAKLLGINPAARVTCVKPEGTASLVLGSSSGIHAWHSKYYIRRVTVLKNEPIYAYLQNKLPKLIEDSVLDPQNTAYICIPIAAPAGAILREKESAISLLERVKKVYKNWIVPGHIKGSNTHNVSTTVTIKPNEWKEVGEWMWTNRKNYSGLSVLPYDAGTYIQTPFEECTEEHYNKMSSHLNEVDLSEIIESDDLTSMKDNPACAGGACTI